MCYFCHTLKNKPSAPAHTAARCYDKANLYSRRFPCAACGLKNHCTADHRKGEAGGGASSKTSAATPSPPSASGAGPTAASSGFFSDWAPAASWDDASGCPAPAVDLQGHKGEAASNTQEEPDEKNEAIDRLKALLREAGVAEHEINERMQPR